MTNPTNNAVDPTATVTATVNGFAALGLSGAILKAVAETGYTTPTPIQAAAIKPLLAGRDLLGLAETGTGKTAAFALPLIQRLVAENRDRVARKCRALILAPTRELAIQIAESIDTYGKHTTLTHTLIFGGVGANPQMRAMQRGVDIVVATPGRLLDLIASRNVVLDEVTHFVLDEADRMLDMGFIHDVRRIVKLLPKRRQSLLFSATMPDDIARLAAEMLNDPQRVEVARTGKTVDRITQSVHFLGTKEKRAALAALLQNEAFKRVIVFTRTKRGANRVADTMDVAGIAAVAIHGNKSQNARQAALESFRRGEARVLVATDIAARGIDIDDISHVINYELPNVPESYVHRIGRTARAGAEGIAIAFCAPDERPFLRDIERLTRTPLANAGMVAGIEKFMNLPEPKRRREDDEDAPQFQRGKAAIDQGRRNNRPFEKSSTGGPPKRSFDKRDGDRPRGDRPSGDRPSGARDDRGGPRGGKPFGDRKPMGNRRPSDGERPRFSRDRDDRGGPRGGKPFGERKPYGDRKPVDDGKRREWKPREERPSTAAGPSATGPGGVGAPAAPTAFNPMDVNTRRPRDDHRREERRDERPRTSDRGGDRPHQKREWKPRDDRAPRADGARRDGKPREDRAPRPPGDRPAWKPREDRASGATGERREWKPREDRAARPADDRPAWKPRDDRGPRAGGERRETRPRSDKPWERRDGGGNRGAGRDAASGGSEPRRRGPSRDDDNGTGDKGAGGA